MKGLVPGRIVHFADATSGSMAHRAAIVTRVFNDDGTVNLTVWAPGGGSESLTSVLPDTADGKLGGTMPTPGTWHWPEPECEAGCRG